MNSRLTLIDGNSILFRAFYGVHSRLTRHDGTPVNAVFGFCNMVLPLLAAADADDVFICVFDAHRKNWRNDIYPEYKANRGETPADLIPQFQIVRDAARALGMPVLSIEDVEADDVIATLCRHECAAGRTTRIVTGDKDLMQLVSDCCFLYDGMKEKEIHKAEVLEKFGVAPNRVIDVQSLMGDSSDNVPGVPGIGPKTAAELINEFGSLDGLYENLDRIKNERRRELLRANRDNAYISRQLVSLKTDVELPEFSQVPYKMDAARAIAFVQGELNSTALATKIEKLFGAVSYPSQKGRNSLASDSEIKNSGVVDYPGNLGQQVAKVSGHSEKGMTSHAFKIITDAQSLDEFLAGVSDTLAIDTETTGLDQMTARIVGISLATAPDAGVYIPIRHIDKNPNDLFGEIKSETRSQKSEISIDTVKQKLWPILTNDNIIKVGHNIKYDLHILENEGWDTSRIAPIDDTMTLSYILHGTAHAHSLDELAHLYLAHDTIKFDSLFPPKTKDADKNFASLDIGAAGEYAAEDAYITFALYKIFRPKVDADETLRKLYENCDRPLIRILLSMERAGVLVDQARLAGLSTILHKKSDELAREIWALAGKEFNIASPQQLAVVLFDELQIAIPGKNRSTDAGVLSEISEAHAIVPKILEWRSLTKLSGTYADALPRQIGADGRIHTTYHQAGTNTGRLSSSGPNLQNIPIKTELGASIRKCFVAAPGKVLISCDYSQVQLRMMADVADVAALKESFARGDDIHEMTARKIFNIPADAPVGKEQRYAAKTVNFSIIYGISPFGLSAQLDIPQSAAKNLIDSYMANFPAIGEYMERTKQFVMAHGFVATPWGRRIELPDVRNPRTRAYALRAAINAPIQGFEADLMRYAMDKVANVIANHKPQIRMIMQVHDEMVFECDAAAAEDWAQKIKSEMENAAKLSVPLVADYSIGNSWE